MKSYTVTTILSLAILLSLLTPSLGDDIKFCPGTFTVDDVCSNISCGYLALFHWPASEMPQKCVCSALAANQSLCTCQIVC
ncbi:unnamed protein product [Cuscuta europaea]|uniref:Uncharacterized protein n=1 Tax=Cuscuta europaea TaxID=41803 RepID=A0A9P0ZNN3_CUSEU|nr:unnamed protein product [Cuscuta europaea]CAH9108371.1 unnamed protein product [Cuscuta europaea]